MDASSAASVIDGFLGSMFASALSAGLGETIAEDDSAVAWAWEMLERTTLPHTRTAHTRNLRICDTGFTASLDAICKPGVVEVPEVARFRICAGKLKGLAGIKERSK